MAEIKLKACPFCGSSKVIVRHQALAPYYYYAQCTQCGAMTNFRDNEQEAINTWNTRKSEKLEDEHAKNLLAGLDQALKAALQMAGNANGVLEGLHAAINALPTIVNLDN